MRRSIIPLALALALLACQQQASSPAAGTEADTTVVATLNGQDLRASDLREWMKDDLYKREIEDKPAGEVFEAKAEALDALMDEMLVAQAAKQAGQDTRGLHRGAGRWRSARSATSRSSSSSTRTCPAFRRTRRSTAISRRASRPTSRASAPEQGRARAAQRPRRSPC